MRPRALRRLAAAAVVVAAVLPVAACGRIFGKTSSSATTTLPTLPPTTTTTIAVPTTPAPATEYVIMRGDTMRKIAAKFNTSVEAIMAVNPTIKDASKIQAGQRILIPPPAAAASRRRPHPPRRPRPPEGRPARPAQRRSRSTGGAVRVGQGRDVVHDAAELEVLGGVDSGHARAQRAGRGPPRG